MSTNQLLETGVFLWIVPKDPEHPTAREFIHEGLAADGWDDDEIIPLLDQFENEARSQSPSSGGG
jgi:hypothetical protein